MGKTPKMTESEIEVQMAAARQELLEENTRNFSSAARVAKTFFKDTSTANLVQWGMVNAFYYAAADA